MKKRSYLVMLSVLGLFVLSGCATLTTGSSQSITVDSKPQGATCTLTRGGKTLAVVNPTPGSVNIDKSGKDITVLCKKEGFNDGVASCSSKFQAMTFGNAIFGGLIGVGIDAISGAATKYPSMVTVELIPTEFNSILERDKFFDNMKAEFVVEASKMMAEISDKCSSAADDQKASCLDEKKTAEASKEKRLNEIENMRVSAKIKASNSQ